MPQGMMMVPPGNRMPPAGNAVPVGGPSDAMAQQIVPLTAATLASAAPDQRKNMIGERLYPLVHNVESTWAGKITGMLLDGMDDAELLHLLESPEDLQDKIGEAMKVLDEAKQQN